MKVVESHCWENRKIIVHSRVKNGCFSDFPKRIKAYLCNKNSDPVFFVTEYRLRMKISRWMIRQTV